MTTDADRVAVHNAGRHHNDADPFCDLCPDFLPMDDVKQKPYIFNPSPRDHIVINGRLNHVRDVQYDYTSEWYHEQRAFIDPPDFYLLFAFGLTGNVEIGKTYSEDAAREALTFMKRWHI